MSFHDIENPTGGMPMERVIDQPTPEQHLLERILSSANMEQGLLSVKDLWVKLHYPATAR